jgi:prepilin-type N-terminal cleavage/methylation domain-containing protein
MKRRMTGKQGFTLIEVMVSSLALAVMVIGGSASFTYGGSMIQRLQTQRNALTVATSVMEDNIRNTGLGMLEQAARDNGEETTFSETFSSGGIDYTATTHVINLVEDGNNVVQVRVSVIAPSIDPVTLCYKGLLGS